MVFDLNWLRSSENSSVKIMASNCLYDLKHTNTYGPSTYKEVNGVLGELFQSPTLMVFAFPLTLTIASHSIKEIYGNSDFFYVRVSTKKGSMKIPCGGTPAQKETAFLNELNAAVPKDVKRGIGFISI